jgi:hypothetical protein
MQIIEQYISSQIKIINIGQCLEFGNDDSKSNVVYESSRDKLEEKVKDEFERTKQKNKIFNKQFHNYG